MVRGADSLIAGERCSRALFGMGSALFLGRNDEGTPSTGKIEAQEKDAQQLADEG